MGAVYLSEQGNCRKVWHWFLYHKACPSLITSKARLNSRFCSSTRLSGWGAFLRTYSHFMFAGGLATYNRLGKPDFYSGFTGDDDAGMRIYIIDIQAFGAAEKIGFLLHLV